jgi:1,5-anhydro-D-fructose reductase (1,5-anhydro-D-mannitol-forming)
VTIRIAQLGTWHVHAKHHVEDARAHVGTEPVVVWDARPGAAAAFGSAMDLPADDDLTRVLARDDVDAVVVDTATMEHPAVITAALAAGKHVFSEKVLATTGDDVRALVELARRGDRVLGVSLPRLTDPAVLTAAALVRGGAIGDLTGSRFRYAHHGAVGTPWIPEHFFDPAQTGGGALIDLGAHPVYLAMLLHGATPATVLATLQHVSGRAVEDNGVLVMDFVSALAVAEVSMVASYLGYSFELSGTGGSIVVGPRDERVLMRQGPNGEWAEQPLVDRGADPFSQWVARVESGASDEAHLATVVAVTDVLEAGYRSDATGVAVAVRAP